MTKGDCDRGYGIPAYPACSGNGVCIPATNKCICNKGWSSLADFHLKDGVDCDIHLPTMIGLAYASLAVASIGTLICFSALFTVGFKKTNGSYNKQIKIIAYLLGFIGLILASSLKISNVEMHLVGSSIGLSVGFFMFLGQLGIGYTVYIDEVVDFLLNSFRFIEDTTTSGIRLESKLGIFKRFSNVPPVVANLTSVFLIAVLVDPDRGDVYSIGYMGNVLTMVSLYEALLISTFPVFIKEMSNLLAARPDAPENAKIKQIHFYLSLVDRLLVLFIFSLCPLLLVFMSWSFLRRKCTYLLWIAFMGGATISALICVTFVSTEKLSRMTVSPSAAILMPSGSAKYLMEGVRFMRGRNTVYVEQT